MVKRRVFVAVVFCLLALGLVAPPPVVVLAQALRPYGLPRDCVTVDALCNELVSLAGRG